MSRVVANLLARIVGDVLAGLVEDGIDERWHYFRRFEVQSRVALERNAFKPFN
jgi:hypothetical protein